jgi:ribosomal protein S18 acetylase RimI-like enzyme
MADEADRRAAVEVWRAAVTVRGRPPSEARVSRIRAKLAEASTTLLVVIQDAHVRGMLAAEPGRAEDGRGPTVSGLCHVSMVFVHPDRQRHGLGRLLMGRLEEEAAGLGYTCLSLWTGADNLRAQGFYRALGFTPSGRTGALADGLAVAHFVRKLV